jgi:DNA polymerase-3 subunit delta'
MTDHWDLIGHEWAVEMLRQHAANDAVRHAYLFTGPPGLGRRTLALRFARALNCQNPPAPGLYCGTCRDCKQIAAMQHPDLAILQAETEGGSLKVDQIREVQRMLSLKSYQARYRVALFLRFHEATENAANALLKTLEEAPAHVILLLTADSAEQLLPTIVSRCEVLRMRPPATDVVIAALQSHGAEADTARLLAHVSGGRPGYALRLLETPSLLEARNGQLDDLFVMLGSTRAKKFSYAEKLAKDKDNARQTLLTWLSLWRDVFLQASGAKTPPANIDYSRKVEAIAGQINLAEARRIVADLEQAVGRLEASVNARLLLEVVLMDWPQLTA